ncbi:MAG TPA: ABC transporter ATP-binding protein [Candidatus Phocaeicola gallinarum]|uniref:ABC transporter ATP-binding protein n=1 Tax=Phocaeicola sp. TaxID=2773926 RepID=UPI001C5C63DF|nr:ABC transporter ATP-binding protein [Candidatus Phocaeicola gallinarum]
MEQQAIVIEGKDLSIGYRKGKVTKYVHRHLNFVLRRGELTCLLGANGTGKSTLLRTLAAAQPALGGELNLLGRKIGAYTERERSRTIGVVLTDKTQAGGLTVYELVALGRQPHTGFFGRLRQTDKDIIRHALQAVGITDKASQYTAELSDGERQKVMIAKALVQECPLILLDEPTAFLDVVSRIEIMTLLHRLAEEEQKAILLSTHDIEQALVLADRLWLLTPENGMECGVTEDLILNNRMDTLFARQNSRIRFDLTHGVFSPTVGGKKSIRLNAANEVLEHWTQNALNRRNYFCLPDETAYAALPLLTVVSPQRIELTVEGQTTVFRSFDQLLQTL